MFNASKILNGNNYISSVVNFKIKLLMKCPVFTDYFLFHEKDNIINILFIKESGTSLHLLGHVRLSRNYTEWI